MAYGTYHAGYLSPAQRLAQLNPAQRAAFTNYIRGVTAPTVAPAPAPAGAPAPAPAPGAPGTTFVLPGSAEAEFQNQRQVANEQYLDTQANINFQAANAGIANRRAIQDIKQPWVEQRANFAAPYGARGVMASGVYRHDLNYATNQYKQALGRQKVDYTRAQAGFNLQRTQAENRHAIAIANIRRKHQAVLGDAAARSVK